MRCIQVYCPIAYICVCISIHRLVQSIKPSVRGGAIRGGTNNPQIPKCFQNTNCFPKYDHQLWSSHTICWEVCQTELQLSGHTTNNECQSMCSNLICLVQNFKVQVKITKIGKSNQFSLPLSRTRLDCTFISSNKSTTYLWTSKYEFVRDLSSSITLSLNPLWGLIAFR